jgi:hypothetical protein
MGCPTPELASAARAMAKAYARALAGLGPEARRQLAASQGAWVRFSRRVCGEGDPRPRSPGRDQEGCLSRAYAERINELKKAVRRLGPFRVVRIDSYAAAEAEDQNSHDPGYFTADHADEWLDVAGLTPVRRAIALRWNRQVAADPWFAGPHWRWMERWAQADPDADENGDYTVERSIDAASDEAISYERDDWTFSHGAPHGHGGTLYGAILLPEWRPLAARDLFAAPAYWAHRFLTRAKKLDGSASEEDLLSPSSWRLDGDGVSIDFGEVHGYAGGDVRFKLGWNELRPFLTPRGVRIARGCAAGRPRQP